MNHTAPGSACACGRDACSSKLMVLFTSDDPEGPDITRKQKHCPDTACIFYWMRQLCQLRHCTHTSLNVSHHLFDQGGQPSPWTCHLTAAFDTEHRMQFNNKTKTKINPNHGLRAILPHNKNFSHLPPITSSHRFIQTSKDVSETAEIMIKRIIYHDTHLHIWYVYMCTHAHKHTSYLSIWRCGTLLKRFEAVLALLLPPAHQIFGCNWELKQQPSASHASPPTVWATTPPINTSLKFFDHHICRLIPYLCACVMKEGVIRKVQCCYTVLAFQF